MACDFKVADASVTEEPKGDGCSLVKLRIGQREYSFAVSPDAPVVRLQYDRNRRLFKGMGFNYIEQTEAKYEAPSFNGVSLLKLPELWRPQIEKLIDDRSLLARTGRTCFYSKSISTKTGSCTGSWSWAGR